MTEQRPIQSTPVGALRFNTDTAKLEYFDGNQYVNITTDSPEQNTGGTRGIQAGGGSSQIEFINIVKNDLENINDSLIKKLNLTISENRLLKQRIRDAQDYYKYIQNSSSTYSLSSVRVLNHSMSS